MNENTRITYADGRVEDVTVTMFHRVAAEKYAKSHGWGTAMECAIGMNAYAAYFRCRQIGGTTDNFDTWLADVVSVTDIPTPVDDDAAPLADGTPEASAN